MSHISQLVRTLADRHLKKYKEGGEGELVGVCPLHSDTTPSFAINLNTGLWVCYAECGGGNLPLLIRKLQYPPKAMDRLLKPARAELAAQQVKKSAVVGIRKTREETFGAVYPLPNSLLGVYEVEPDGPELQPLHGQGFDPGFLADYEIGYDFRHDRITFPIRDIYGTLAGISGRAVLDGQWPRYLVYTKELGEYYPGYKIDKRRHLWNMDRVYKRLYSSNSREPVIIVEGFKAALWLIQHGHESTIALMGSGISSSQIAQIHRLGHPITLFLDNDPTGRKKAIVAWDKLFGPIQVHPVCYPDNRNQPDDYSPSELDTLLQATPKKMSK